MAAPILRTSKSDNVNWLTLLVFVGFHVGAVAALFFFSWKALVVTALLYWTTLSFGIGMGYHRLHTHRAYWVPKPLEYFLAVMGTLTLEGGPIFWVGVHRIHHQNSDKEGDPHSPRDGAFWAHAGWMIFGENLNNKTALMSKYAPDLSRDPFYRWLTTYHWVPLVALGLGLWAWGGFTLVLWGIFLRVTLGLHATWAVNSLTHMFGSRRFKTRDDSRNNLLVALFTFGEGWHNNHHALPTSARHGMAWYEIDVTWMQIRFLEILGIARNVKVPKTGSPLEEKAAA